MYNFDKDCEDDREMLREDPYAEYPDFPKECKELVLSDPDSSLSVNEVMDFYSMTYPELTTATVHGPEWEEDKAVYRFKTTIGVKG